jgi:hypothetical protein
MDRKSKEEYIEKLAEVYRQVNHKCGTCRWFPISDNCTSCINYDKYERWTRMKVGFVSDGSSADYYDLPSWARELQDLIRYKNMNGAQAEMFRALYRGDSASHSDEKRQAKKLLCYAVDEIVRTHFPDKSFVPCRDAVFNVLFPNEDKS